MSEAEARGYVADRGWRPYETCSHFGDIGWGSQIPGHLWCFMGQGDVATDRYSSVEAAIDDLVGVLMRIGPNPWPAAR